MNNLINVKTQDIESCSMGLILLFLMVACNYVSEMINCSLQRAFSSSRFTKLLILFFTIFILVIVTNRFYPDKHPRDYFVISSILLVLFIIATKNKPIFIITTLIIWFIIYYIQLLRKYEFKKINYDHIQYEKHKLLKLYKYTPEEIDRFINYNKTITILFKISIVIVVIGFIDYYRLKRIEHKKNWSIITFLLGTNKCKNKVIY